MNQDERGVAGFFEDLPVLMFVLAGTFTIVVSAWNSSLVVVSREENMSMERLADRFAEFITSELVGDDPEVIVTVGSVCSTVLIRAVDEFMQGRNFSMGIVMIHPNLKWLLKYPERSSGVPDRAYSSSRLLNALANDGGTSILAVRVVVW